MYKKILTVCALTFLFSTSSYAKDDTYFCVAENSTGFFFKNGKWDRAFFDVSKEKYIIRKLKKGELFFGRKNYTYGVYPLGDDVSVHGCKLIQNATEMLCDGVVSKLFISLKAGRFLKTYNMGYWEGEDNNKNTPHIMIGRCSKI